MAMSSIKDKKIAISESETKRQKKKNSSPPYKGGEQVTGYEKLRTQGKGDKNRIPGADWYGDEITERLKNIYGKKKTK